VVVYLEWFAEICRRTAEMIVHWQRVGFVHGVMNTDNMSILGLTIDYGPYGWLENYDPDWTPNTTDAGERRYRFGNQPQIVFWNLAQLAKAIYPLIGKAKLLQQVMDNSGQQFEQSWQQMHAEKLGLDGFDAAADWHLIEQLLELLPVVETDMTIFYRRLAMVAMNPELTDDVLIEPLLTAFYVPEQLTGEYKARLGNWLRQYIERVKRDAIPDDERRQRMNAINPKYVLRNYLAQLAIDNAEQGDYALVNELLEVLRYPYEEQPDNEKYAEKRPDWARQRAGCSMLSCSS